MRKKVDLEHRMTDLELLAKEIVADLDAVAAKIERFERWQHEPEHVVRGLVNVPKPFLVSAIALVEQTPELLAVKTLDPAEGHETIEYLNAFEAVSIRINTLASRLKENMKSRKARLAMQAMQVYALAKSLARLSRDAAFIAQVETLGGQLGPRGRPRKARNP